MNCKYCGFPLPEGSVFCGNCGMESTPEPAENASGADGVYCSQCGTELFPEDAFCPECGMPVNRNNSDGKTAQSFGGYGGGVIYDNNTYNNSYNNYNNGYNMQPPQQQTGKKSKTALIIVIIAAVLAAAAAAVAIWKWEDISDMLGIGGESESTETVKHDSDKDYEEDDGDSEEDDDYSPDDGGFIEPESEYFYDSDSEYITASELDSYSRDEVRLILNEMYARHGYIFTTDENRRYFEGKPWYHGNTSSQDVVLSRFNSIEKANRQTIIDYEQAHGWR